MNDNSGTTDIPPSTPYSARPGAVVLVSYRPPPDLFRIQLQSIRDQTRRDYRCFIAADGDEAETRGLVEEAVGADRRFEVIGFPGNVGVYLNVDRALAALPADLAWVALADQDDRWHPDKLDRLLPLLDRASLGMGQARVISWPSRGVLQERTTRRALSVADLVLENQVSGGLAVIRRDVLEVALPFPRHRSPSQYPDHWLGVCAAALDGYVVLEQVVQDYVQHGGNLVGESLLPPSRRPLTSLRSIQRLADEYEGGHSLAQCARTYASASFGWRRAMVQALLERLAEPAPELADLDRLLRLSSGPGSLARLLQFIRTSSEVSSGTFQAFVAGTPYELGRRVGRSMRGVQRRPVAPTRVEK